MKIRDTVRAFLNGSKKSLEAEAGRQIAALQAEIDLHMGNRCLTAAGCTIGTGSAAKVKVANTVTFAIANEFGSKASYEQAFTATTHDIPADADTVQEACYLLCVNDKTASAPTLHMGEIATGAGQAEFPETPTGKVAIGGVRVAVAAGATPFDASSDLLSAGHITDTYYDFAYNRPAVHSKTIRF